MSHFLVLIIVLINVAYLIVVERKWLGIIQLRQGPNKVGFKGLAQPLADGVKLFTKEVCWGFSGSGYIYFLGPFICFFLSYGAWVIFPSFFTINPTELGVLFIICVSRRHVFGTFLVGWSVDSSYSSLGAMRRVAQRISYEVVFRTLLLCPLLVLGSYSFVIFRLSYFPLVVLMFEVFLLWLIVVLAELNRAPFDFVEGESELVSGYTVEYGGVGFALIALAEYGNIYFIRIVISVLFGRVFLGRFLRNILLSFEMVIFCLLIIRIRGRMPRYRYDLLMAVCWKKLLPLRLLILMYYFLLLSI